MRAWLLPRPGSWRDMALGETPEPSPAQGDVRVAVHAVGLNPVDYKIARMGHPDWRFPHILGLDVAGVVDATGSSVTHWRPGDRVFYHSDLSKPGGFAEFAVTTAHTVARIPDGMSFVDAASLPCAGFTAYHALHRRLHVRAGQSILVHAGAGGVGGLAIQLAAHAGLKVLTTCSANNADYVCDLGAEVAIDYHTENLKQVVLTVTDGRGIDAILSSLGSERATQDLDLLAFNGGLACLLGLPDLTRLQPFTISPSIHEVSLGSAHLSGDKRAQEDLARMADELAALIIQGAVRLPPIEVIPWREIPAGLDRLAREMDEEPDVRYRDDEILPGGLKAVHSPGPEQAHYAFWREQAPSVLFCPDLVMRVERGGLEFIPPEYHEDPGGTRASVRRLLELPFDVFCMDHGAPLTAKPHEALRRLMR